MNDQDMNDRSEMEQRDERTSTADLAGMAPERGGVATEPGYEQTENSGTVMDPSRQGFGDGQMGYADGNGNGAGNGNGMNRVNGGDGHTAAASAPASTNGEDGSREPLLQHNDAEALHTRWTEVQTQFVDDPRRAVQDADALVAELMQRLAKMFADERSGLERQWSAGSEVSTEDLRMALRRYRSFFERLLSV